MSCSVHADWLCDVVFVVASRLVVLCRACSFRVVLLWSSALVRIVLCDADCLYVVLLAGAVLAGSCTMCASAALWPLFLYRSFYSVPLE